jgi:hypothetical protein
LIFRNVAIIPGGKQLQIIDDGHAERVAEEVKVKLKAS